MTLFNSKSILLSLILSASLLVGCGGGGGGGGDNGGGPTNSAPQADAGANFTVTSGDIARLQGSATDNDGEIAQIAWQQSGGPQVTLDNAAVLEPSFTAPEVTTTTTLTFRLEVTDDDQASAQDTVQVQIDPAPALSDLTVDSDFDYSTERSVQVNVDANGANAFVGLFTDFTTSGGGVLLPVAESQIVMAGLDDAPFSGEVVIGSHVQKVLMMIWYADPGRAPDQREFDLNESSSIEFNAAAP